MSDYLHHLVTRTLAPEAGVRPQLRSAFEPPPLHGGFTLPADLELDTLVESASSAFPPLSGPAQFEGDPIREPLNAGPKISPMGDEPPRQVVPPPRPPSIRGDAPPPESDEDKDIAPVQPLQPPDRELIKPTMLQPVMGAPPDSIPENGRAISTPRSPPRANPIRVPRRVRAALTSDTAHPGAHQTVESEELRSEQVAVVAIRAGVPAATVLSPSPSVAPASFSPGSAAEAIRNQTVESEERRSERFVAGAIRPVAPAAPIFSPSLAPAVALPPPTIHVTIGRVEVRATPPPAGSRSKAARPPVMSLDEYLGRRASGGQR